LALTADVGIGSIIGDASRLFNSTLLPANPYAIRIPWSILAVGRNPFILLGKHPSEGFSGFASFPKRSPSFPKGLRYA